MADNINPDHYKRLPAEAIDIIEAMIAGAPDNKAAYLHGQAAKYDLRLWRKGESLEDYLADLGKHIWYALRLESHLLELIEKQKADEQQKASDLQSLKDHPFGKLKQPKWTPKIGDWVRIKNIDPREAWMPEMDKYDGKIVQVEEFDGRSIVHDEWCFLFDWLEPAEQPVVKQSSTTEPPDGWRWLEVGEVIRKGDKPKNGDAVPLFWIGTPCCNNQFILRRNKFEVGEKVVHGDCKSLSISVVGKILGDGWVDLVRNGVSTAYHVKDLAPYIEDTVEVAGEVTGEVKPPDGWRFLEVGEVIRKGDRCFTNHSGSIDCFTSVGEKFNHEAHYPTIRRNKFEVGEKVVTTSNGNTAIVLRLVNRDLYEVRPDFSVCIHMHAGDLAPYIEEAK